MQYLTLQNKYVAYRVPCSNDSLNQYCYKTFCKFLCLTHILPVHYGLNTFLLDLKYDEISLSKRGKSSFLKGYFICYVKVHIWILYQKMCGTRLFITPVTKVTGH